MYKVQKKKNCVSKKHQPAYPSIHIEIFPAYLSEVHKWRRYKRAGPPLSSQVLQLFIPPTAPRVTILKVLFRSNQVSGVLLGSSPSLYRICYIQSYTNTTREISWNSWDKHESQRVPLFILRLYISVSCSPKRHVVRALRYLHTHTHTHTHVVNSYTRWK